MAASGLIKGFGYLAIFFNTQPLLEKIIRNSGKQLRRGVQFMPLNTFLLGTRRRQIVDSPIQQVWLVVKPFRVADIIICKNFRESFAVG